MSSLAVDDLEFEIRRSSRRKTVGITVERDGRLILHAPEDAPHQALEKVARDSRLWIYTKLAERELLFRPARQKEWVSGESLYYLGRSYRLLVLAQDRAARQAIRLYGGYFELRRDQLPRAEERLRAWYADHGRAWITPRVEMLADRIGCAARKVVVRDLGNRWASCGHEGTLYFHWQALALPPRMIEYLIVHEMVHLLVPRHNTEFWSRVERVLPDYETRKRWLAEHGGRYVWTWEDDQSHVRHGCTAESEVSR